MKKRFFPLLMLLTLLLSVLPLRTAAITPLDTDRKCSLQVHFYKDDYRFSGMETRIYRVAKASSDGTFDLIAPFSGFPVSIHGIQSQREWKIAAATMVSCLVDQQIPPSYTTVSDAQGTASFTGLPTGLYLVLGTTAENDTGIYTFEDFFVYLPTPQSYGSFLYDMEARPKPGEFVPKTEFTVKKLWNDYGNSKNRPSSVTVNIYQDQNLFDTVTLDASNNWSHSWKTTDANSQWTVAEKEVPEGYTVTVTEKNGIFSITNSKAPSPEEPPKTGDSFGLWYYLMAMCLSGFLLLILGIWHQRKTK